MTAVVLDAGALIALDRGDTEEWAMLRAAVDAGDLVQVPAGTIGQAWRNGQRQVLLARALSKCEEVPLDGATARASGMLCERSGSSHVIDASVAVAAAGLAGHERILILTSDPDDIGRLASVLGTPISLVRV